MENIGFVFLSTELYRNWKTEASNLYNCIYHRILCVFFSFALCFISFLVLFFFWITKRTLLFYPIFTNDCDSDSKTAVLLCNCCWCNSYIHRGANELHRWELSPEQNSTKQSRTHKTLLCMFCASVVLDGCCFCVIISHPIARKLKLNYHDFFVCHTTDFFGRNKGCLLLLFKDLFIAIYIFFHPF